MISIVWIPSPLSIAGDWDDFRDSLSDFQEPFERSITTVVNPSIKTNFAKGGRPSWAPLAAFTVSKKGHSRILQESGDLASAASDLNSWDIGSHDAELVDVPEYGKYQNAGFFNVMFGVDVVARQWAVFQAKDIDAIVQTFIEWLEEKYNETN